MAIGVVDWLEQVQVYKYYSKASTVSLGEENCALQSISKGCAIGEAGELVVVGEMGEPLTGTLALGCEESLGI